MSVYICKIQIMPVRVPLKEAVWAPQLKIKFRDYLLVRLDYSDDSFGIGFSYIGTGGGLSAAIACKELLCETVLGTSSTDPEDVQSRLKFITRIQGRGGLVQNAISALDIAIWDRNARVQELPLYQTLTADTVKRVPAYASGGYLTGSYNPDALEKEIDSYLQAGFVAIKLKCAFGTLPEDLKRLELARKWMGDKTELMLDAYNRWQTVEEALPAVTLYKDLNPYWVEDPFEPDLLFEMGELKQQLNVRLATGEFYFNASPFDFFARQGSADIFQAEAPRCGGITEWLNIASVAEEHCLEMAPCWFHDLHVHLVAACP
ncbi:MAG: mandelate racemase/muconate lactonizing enzyme family protein, partial [Sneathiella sp.]